MEAGWSTLSFLLLTLPPFLVLFGGDGAGTCWVGGRVGGPSHVEQEVPGVWVSSWGNRKGPVQHFISVGCGAPVSKEVQQGGLHEWGFLALPVLLRVASEQCCDDSVLFR